MGLVVGSRPPSSIGLQLAAPKAERTQPPDGSYPPTPVRPESFEVGGKTLTDPFLWLEQMNAPEVQAWVAAQNAHAEAFLKALPELQGFHRGFRDQWDWAWTSPRVKRGEREFWVAKPWGLEKPKLYCREPDGTEKLLLDPDRWEHGSDRPLLCWDFTLNGRYLSYVAGDPNGDYGDLHIVDLSTGQRRDAVIPNARGGDWDADGKGFFYASVQSSEQTNTEWRYHALGSPISSDPRIDVIPPYLTPLGTLALWTDETPNGEPHRYWVSANAPGLSKREIPLPPGVELSSVSEVEGELWAICGKPGEDKRLIAINPEDPSQQRTVVELGGREEQHSFKVRGGRLILHRTRDGYSRLFCSKLDGSESTEIPMPSKGTLHLGGNDRVGELFIQFNAPDHATETFDLDPLSGKLTSLVKMDTGSMEPSRYRTEAMEYRSTDGTSIPLTVIRANHTELNGEVPTALYVYGGFGITTPIRFMPSWGHWLDKGGAVAIAGVRGGGERGEGWHRAGWREHKQQSIEDVIAAAEHLISSGLTRPGKLALLGGSQGGMMVGATITQRPDLFGAACAQVPVMDLARFDRMSGTYDLTNLAGHREYGHPDQPQELERMLEYSPYHHVRAGVRYPSILLTCAEHDIRVPGPHAWKMAAALQRASVGGPVLVRTTPSAGHVGTADQELMLRQGAEEHAFLWNQLNPPTRHDAANLGWG